MESIDAAIWPKAPILDHRLRRDAIRGDPCLCALPGLVLEVRVLLDYSHQAVL